MLKNFFKKIFGSQSQEQFGNFIVAQINDKIMPIDRGEVYEDRLDQYLKENGFGEVTGGGTMQFKTGEIDFCDVEIKLKDEEIDEEIIKKIIYKLEQLGAPKGSVLRIEKLQSEIQFGKKEGIGIYLDGVNLDNDVYQNSDSNFVMTELKRLTNDTSTAERFWEGTTETGFYYYADSFEQMKNQTIEFLNSYPLCKNARVDKIA